MLKLGLACVAFLAACGGTTSTDGDGGTDGSSNDAAAGDGSKTDATSGDAATSDGSAGSLTCGTTTCPGSQGCCVDPNNAGTYTCTNDAGTCPAGDALLACNSNAQCPSSQVCCLDGTVDPAVAACSSTCTGTDHAVLCDPTASSTTNRCGDAGTCGNTNIDTWQLTDSYGTCGDVTGPF